MKKIHLCYLSGFIVFAVYLATMCPTIYPGDSPEFITAASTLGIAHPPGYPGYCLPGKLFTLLPFGSVAYRVNLLSGVFGSLTVMLLYLVMLKVTGNALLALGLSLAGGLSRVFWSQAVMAEVYTLNAFFLFLAFYLMLLWSEGKGIKYLFLFSFIFGAGLTNHYLLVIALPAYVYIFLAGLREADKKTPAKALPVLAGFFLLGLLPYVYLVIRSRANPPLDWGNPESITGFIKHVLRLQYRAFETSEQVGLGTKLLFAWDFLVNMLKQYPLVWVFSLPGLALLYRRNRKFLVASVLIFLLNVIPVVLMLQFRYNPTSTGIVEVYYLPAYLIFAVWICAGLAYLLEKVKAIPEKAVLAVVLIPALLLALNFHKNNLRNHYFLHDFGRNILQGLEQNAFLNVSGDDGIVFPMLYMKHVEKFRQDIGIRDPYGLLLNDSLEGHHTGVYHAAVVDSGENREQVGFVYRFNTPPGSYGREPLWWAKYEKRGLDGSVYQDYWTRGITARYPLALGMFYLSRGVMDKGKAEVQKAFGIAHDIPWLLTNIGYAYVSNGLYEEAIEVFKRLEEVDPGNKKNYRSLASCYRELGLVDETINTYRKLLKYEPSAEIYSFIASLYSEQGNTAEAIRYYETAIKKKNDYAEAYNNIGILHRQEGRQDEAIARFREALEHKPGYSTARFNLAMAYLDRDLNEAIKQFEEILRTDPEFGQVHYNLGIAYEKAGNPDRALAAYRAGIKQQPGHASQYKNAGILCLNRGERGNAVAYWKKYLELNPGAPDAEIIKKEINKLKG